jgi:hypothetical protein
MHELFGAMMKEEWRVHSTMFGNLSFALFPVMIFGISFMSSFLIPLMSVAVPPGGLTLIVHANFLLLGFMVGAFGLLGSEVMNRRFGQASLLAYSARSLPLSERYIFTTFVVKDIVYYFILWVMPFCAGYILASPFTGVPFSRALLLLLTVTFSFLSGLCLVFFLSSLYARSPTALAACLVVLFGVPGILVAVTGLNPVLLFPPLLLYSSFSWTNLVVSAGVLAVLFSVSVLLFNPDAMGRQKEHTSRLVPLTGWLSFLPRSSLVAKDLIDLYRSGSVIGQMIFSFLVPLLVIWFFLSMLGPFLPPHGLFFMFALITGVIASTMYTWVTMFDSYGPYACLPVAVHSVIAAKVTSFCLLQVAPAVLLVVFAVFSGETAYVIPAVVLCLAVSIYGTGISVWLTGLSPSVLVYDVRVLMSYLVLMGIALAVLTSLAFAGPYYSLASLLLIIPAWLMVRRGMVRWDAAEQAGF